MDLQDLRPQIERQPRQADISDVNEDDGDDGIDDDYPDPKNNY